MKNAIAVTVCLIIALFAGCGGSSSVQPTGELDINAGYYVSGNSGQYADVLTDGTFYGPVGDWTLAIIATDGGGVNDLTIKFVLCDSTGHVVPNSPRYHLNGHYDAYVENANGRVVAHRKIWADPGYPGRG